MATRRDRQSSMPYTYPIDFVTQEERGSSESEPDTAGLWQLALLVVVLAVSAVALYLLGGTPHLPEPWPSWDTITVTLRGSYLPPEVVAYVVSTLGWLLWVWTVSSLLLETLVVTAETVSSGAAWAGTLRKLSRWLSIPLVRRVVDGTLGAVLLAQVVTRPPLEGSPSGLTTVAVAYAAPLEHAAAPHLAPMTTEEEEEGEGGDQDEGQFLQYTVRAGDNLWDIAKHFYGTGEEWPRLMEANVGHRMSDGRVFPREGVIQPGWVLRVPRPSRNVEVVGTQATYMVEAGDTLYGIAARLLGDETRWPEIFELNRGVARLDDGRTLTTPELIWPGLRLRLPLAVQAGSGAAPRPIASTAAPTPASDLASAPPATLVPTASPAPMSTAQIAAPEEAPPRSVDATGAGAQPAPSRDAGSLPLAAAAAAAAGALGGAALLARWRSRPDPDGPPIPNDDEEEVPLQRGFALAEPARTLTHRLHGQEAELALLAAEHLRVFLAQRGIRQVGLLTVWQGRRRLSLTLTAPLRVRAELVEAMNAFRKRLGLRGSVRLTPDQDVEVEVSWLRRAAFLTPPDGPPKNPPWLLPLGMLDRRQTLYVNWREVSNLLVAGSAGADVQTVMTSLLTALGARCQPPYLRLWVIADRQRLAPPLLRLPHLRGAADPRETARLQVLLEEVRQTVLRRMAEEEELGLYRTRMLMGPPEPEVLVAVGDLGEVAEHQEALEFIGRNGPAYGVRLLGATTAPAELEDELLERFGTRVMLGLEDEGSSLRLMGTPDGVDLDGGRMLVRVEGRDVLPAHGFAVAPEQLEQVVEVMQEAYLRDLVSTGRVTGTPGMGAQPITFPTAQGPERAPGQVVAAATDGPVTIPAPDPRSDLPDGEAPPEVTGAMTGSETDTVAPGLFDLPEDGEEEPCADAAVGPLGDLPGSEEAGVATEEIGTTAPVELPPEAGPAPASGPLTVAPHVGEEVRAQVQGPPVVEVRCFGGLTVTCGGRTLSPVGPDGAQFRAWEFLAVIATGPAQGVSKEHIAGILWPDSDPRKAERRLPNVLARLRGVLSFQVPGLTGDVIQIDRAGVCRFNPTYITSDVHQFLALCQEAARLPAQQARARWERALALYQGDLLRGVSYEWAQDREEGGLTLVEHYRSAYLRVVRDLAAGYLAEGEAARAAPLYHRLVERDGADEEAVRCLLRCYQHLGDRTAVLREMRQLKQALAALFAGDDDADEDADFEPEPSPATMAVYAEVMADLEARARRAS